MLNLTISPGSDTDFPLRAWNRGGLSNPVFGATDTLSANLWPGDSETALFQPTVIWYTANGTQTGYEQGEVLLTISAAQAAQLEQLGNYSVEVWWTQTGTGRKERIIRATLSVTIAAGQGVQTVVPYCTYQDLLDQASWVRMIQSETDQEGFLDKRLQAREWLDWCILNNYRGSAVGMFEMHSTMAFAFGGYSGLRRSLGPSLSLVDYLQRDMLMIRPQIKRLTAYKTISFIGRSQIGMNNQFATFGSYFEAMADREATGTTCEIDINADGWAELFVPLSSTNTLFT
jgi:hypothetical protein